VKFGSSIADIFIIKHTPQSGYDAFRFDTILHCLGL